MALTYKSAHSGATIDGAVTKVVEALDGNVASATKLQKELTAGSNITINNGVISATIPSVNIPNITFGTDSTSTPSAETVTVMTNLTASGHTLTRVKYNNMPTTHYVDNKIKSTTGTGTTVTMSQKAITDEFAAVQNTIGNINQALTAILGV